jgi:hypothetical protein
MKNAHAGTPHGCYPVSEPLRWVRFDNQAPHCGAVSPFFCGKTAGYGVFPRHMSVEKRFVKKRPCFRMAVW